MGTGNAGRPGIGPGPLPAAGSSLDEAALLERGERGTQPLVLHREPLPDYAERFHQMVRAIEALVLARKGETRKTFVRRAGEFVKQSKQIDLGMYYDLRSKCEHFEDIRLAVGKKKLHRDKMNTHLHRIESLVRHIFAQILSARDITESFRTETSLHTFWKEIELKQRSVAKIELHLVT